MLSAPTSPWSSTRRTCELKRVVCVVGLLVCGWLAAPRILAGQTAPTGTLSGQVLDVDTREPVEGAQIVLEGLDRKSISNRSGRFAITGVPTGRVHVRVERLGYARTSGDVQINAHEVTEIVLQMSTEAVPLEALVVTAHRREVQLPEVEGLDRRYYSGWGRFVMADEIRRRNPTKLTQVLGETGLEVTGNGTSVKLSRANCAPAVFVDGVKVTHPGLTGTSSDGAYEHQWADPGASPSQDAAYNLNLVHPSDVAAVEVYRSALETPAEFLDTDSRCGAVVVWTRRGTGLAGAGDVATDGSRHSAWKRGLVAASLAALGWLAQAIF